MPAVAEKPQAISGVSAGIEAEIETVYPSIASSGLGQSIGSLCDSIDAKINGIKLSCLLFAPLVAPLALAAYGLSKLSGRRYRLTNRSLQILTMIGVRPLQSVALKDISNIAVVVRKGQAFYHAGDLQMLNAKGEAILVLPGVSRPERFRQIILDAREARVRSDESLAVIQARG